MRIYFAVLVSLIFLAGVLANASETEHGASPSNPQRTINSSEADTGSSVITDVEDADARELLKLFGEAERTVSGVRETGELAK